MKTSIMFYPNTKKQSSKNSLVPIYLRLLHLGKKKEKRLNVTLKVSELNLWDKHIDRLSKRDSPINDYLNSITSTFNRWNIGNANTRNKFSIDGLMNILTGDERDSSNSLNQFCENYYEDVVSRNSNITLGTVKNYRKSITHLKNYLSIQKMTNVNIDEFTKADAINFKTYLTSRKEDKTKGMKETSASSIIKKLRPIFICAIDNGIINRNPFDGVKLSNRYEQKPRLNIQEIKQLKDLDLSDNLSLMIYRDMFLFSCTTGLSYSDLMGLKRTDLTMIGQNLLMETNRDKTDYPVKQYLPNLAKEIYFKYVNDIETNITKTVLPKRSLNNANEKLKVLAAKAQITKVLSTNIARHTCKQLLSEAKVYEPSAVYSIMGWSRSGRIEFNYTRTTDTILLEAKANFDNYLEKNL